MAATKLQANWTAVAHGTTSRTRVSSVSINQGGSLSKFSADGDLYPTVIAALMSNPSASVTSADVASLMAISPGTTATLTATHSDAKGAASGAIAYTLANAVSETAQTSGQHAQFGTATISFQAFSSDGTTNPLSFTRS